MVGYAEKLRLAKLAKEAAALPPPEITPQAAAAFNAIVDGGRFAAKAAAPPPPPAARPAAAKAQGGVVPWLQHDIMATGVRECYAVPGMETMSKDEYIAALNARTAELLVRFLPCRDVM